MTALWLQLEHILVFGVQKGISAAMTNPISNPTSYQLVRPIKDAFLLFETSNFVFFQRSLVLDYLCHNCYTRTATAFSRDSTIRHLDADGDEIVDSEAVDVEDSNDSTGGPTEQFENFMKQVALRQGTQYSSVLIVKLTGVL